MLTVTMNDKATAFCWAPRSNNTPIRQAILIYRCCICSRDIYIMWANKQRLCTTKYASFQRLNQLGRIHHLYWQVGYKRVNPDLCTLSQNQGCNDHPAFSFISIKPAIGFDIKNYTDRYIMKVRTWCCLPLPCSNSQS